MFSKRLWLDFWGNERNVVAFFVLAFCFQSLTYLSWSFYFPPIIVAAESLLCGGLVALAAFDYVARKDFEALKNSIFESGLPYWGGAFAICTLLSNYKTYSALKSLQILVGLWLGGQIAVVISRCRGMRFFPHTLMALCGLLSLPVLFGAPLANGLVLKVLCLISFVYIAVEYYSKGAHSVLLAYVFLLFMLILRENSKSICLASLIGLGAVTLLVKGNRKRLAQIFAAVALGLFLFYGQHADQVRGRVKDLTDPFASTSTLPRLALLKVGARAFVEKPWFGHGVAVVNLGPVFDRYYDPSIIESRKTDVFIPQHNMTLLGDRRPGVHNTYLDVLVSGGVFLGCVFAFFLWTNFRRSDPTQKAVFLTIAVLLMSWQYMSSLLGAAVIGLLSVDKKGSLKT